MMSSIQRVFQQVSQLFDALGYVLMIAVSLMMWWGIYSGVGVVMSDDAAQQRVVNNSLTHENGSRHLPGEHQVNNWLVNSLPLQKANIDWSGQ